MGSVRTVTSPNAQFLISMKARSDMTIFDWRRQVEELRDLVALHVDDEDWPGFDVYGPDNEGFGAPGVALTCTMSRGAFTGFAIGLRDLKPHMTCDILVYVCGQLEV